MNADRRSVEAESALLAVLAQVEHAGQGSREVAVADIIERLGTAAFGPALLVLGLVALSPIGDIPGVPTVMGLVILLIAGQLLAARQRFWLPGWLLKRRVNSSRLLTTVRYARPAARFLGRFLKPRLTFLTDGPFARAAGGFACLLALSLPPLEFVPFAATVPSSALTLLGLALVTRDGLLAALALLLGTTAAYLVTTALLTAL